jgi:hypothetical protein
VVIAGGAIASCIHKQIPEDIDLFFYGLDDDQLMQKIEDIYLKLLEQYEVKRYDGEHCITFIADDLPPIQCILRKYRNIAEIIYGFDIGACQLAFDGSNIYTTIMGKLAYETGYNVVDLEVRRHSYERRLCRYFNKYKFGIVMPKAVTQDDVMGLTFIKIDSRYCFDNRVITNYLAAIVDGYVTGYSAAINYKSRFDIAKHNIECFVHGRQNAMIGIRRSVRIPPYGYGYFHNGSIKWIERMGGEKKVKLLISQINLLDINIIYHIQEWDYRTAFQDAMLCSEAEWIGL